MRQKRSLLCCVAVWMFVVGWGREAPAQERDTTAPKVNCPGAIQMVCENRNGAVVKFDVTAADDTDRNVKVVCAPASGSTFPIGVTKVVCSASDSAGNVGRCQFNVTVTDTCIAPPEDTTPPAIVCPRDRVVDCEDQDGSVVTFEVQATDDTDRSPDVTCAPASGSVFPIGTTTVQCRAVDRAGNVSRCEFEVTVTRECLKPPPDETPPRIVCPRDLTVDCEDESGAVVRFEVTATDDMDSSPEVACVPEPGSVFPVGTTIVNCRARDAAGNESLCGFRVTVTRECLRPPPDETPPRIVCPRDLTVDCEDENGAVVRFEVTATDDMDSSPVVACVPEPGSVFPVGTTIVNCRARDAAGNESLCEFDVTVTRECLKPPPDETPPRIVCPRDLIVDCEDESGAVVRFEVTATDDMDSSPVVACVPEPGSVFPVGTTIVNCRARDAAGNESLCGFRVTVECERPVCGGVENARQISSAAEQVRIQWTLPPDCECDELVLRESGAPGELVRLPGDARSVDVACERFQDVEGIVEIGCLRGLDELVTTRARYDCRHPTPEPPCEIAAGIFQQGTASAVEWSTSDDAECGCIRFLILADGEQVVQSSPAGDSIWSFDCTDLPEGTDQLCVRCVGENGSSTTVCLPIDCPLVGYQVPGDCNQDGTADISDVLCVLGHLFTGTPVALPCGDGTVDASGNRQLLDWDGDSQVTVSDAVALAAHLFQGGPSPLIGTTLDCVEIEECGTVCAP